jgi:molybdopterin-guanine dinucleotide biosynthesis protein MobB
MTPVVSFVGRSGTGKTTFLEKLLPKLTEHGLRVLVVKHDVHKFEVDKPGKDSWRLAQAGAWRVLLTNANKMALMGATDGDVPLLTLVERYAGDADLVITEGFRKSSVPKFVVVRDGAPERLDPNDPELENVVGVVTDDPIDSPHTVFPLGDPGPTADFIVRTYVHPETGRRALTGVLLAGGRGERMGFDKALLTFGGKPLLPRLVLRMAQECDGGVLVVRRPGQPLPDLPAYPGIRVVDDLIPDQAALGGLYTGLALAPTPWIFLAACDMPLLDPGLIAWMRELPANADALLPIADGRPQPTHAIYGHRCLGAIKRSLLSGELGFGAWRGSVKVRRISEREWRRPHLSGHSFVNVNTPEDLIEAEAMAAGTTEQTDWSDAPDEEAELEWQE